GSEQKGSLAAAPDVRQPFGGDQEGLLSRVGGRVGGQAHAPERAPDELVVRPEHLLQTCPGDRALRRVRALQPKQRRTGHSRYYAGRAPSDHGNRIPAPTAPVTATRATRWNTSGSI